MKNSTLIKVVTLLLTVLIVANCADKTTEAKYPGSQEDERRKRLGSLSGEGGLLVFGRDEEAGSSGASGIGINSYLWRATLDTVSFMPLASADPFGGVIITDWYESPDAKGERYKVNVLITSERLRSDAVKVSVFKQEYGKSGWKDVAASDKVARDLEDKILTRARELRVSKEKK